MDNRTVKIELDKVIKYGILLIYSGYVHKVEGEGLPIFGSPENKGDLYVKIFVDFPDTISDEAKQGMCLFILALKKYLK